MAVNEGNEWHQVRKDYSSKYQPLLRLTVKDSKIARSVGSVSKRSGR